MTSPKNSSHLGPLPKDWMPYLHEEFSKEYMSILRAFLQKSLKDKAIIYPSLENIFRAFFLTPFSDVKIVIVGQDPYHGPMQANGLAFSVHKNIAIPPSLINIYKEICLNFKLKKGPSLFAHGDLSSWAKQGVFLLNSVLTVEASNPASHQNKGWEVFTDTVLKVLNNHKENLVFILWGSFAQKKGAFLSPQKHLILKSPHPSPLSAHRGFFGQNHFKKANDYLVAHQQRPIDWCIY